MTRHRSLRAAKHRGTDLRGEGAGRVSAGYEVISGANAVEEALRAGRRTFRTVFVLAKCAARWDGRFLGMDIDVVDPAFMERMAQTTEHQGIAAMVSPYPYARLEDLFGLDCIVMLDSVEDPRNLGAVIRAAHALAGAGVVIQDRRASPITPSVVRASAGAVEHTRVARVTNLTQASHALKEKGYWLVGLDADAEETIENVPAFERLVLVVGGEDRGIRRLLRSEMDMVVRIPMREGFNSLNLSQATSIALYELHVRRRMS